MRYRVIAPMGVTLRPPILLTHLTEAQIKLRKHLLKPVQGGHEILSEVQFKRGETVGIEAKEGSLPKALLEQLADPETGEKASARPAAAAKKSGDKK